MTAKLTKQAQESLLKLRKGTRDKGFVSNEKIVSIALEKLKLSDLVKELGR